MINTGTAAYVGLGIAAMVGINAFVRPFDARPAEPAAMAMALRDASGDLTEYGARMMLEQQRKAEIEDEAEHLAAVQSETHEQKRTQPPGHGDDRRQVASTGQPAPAALPAASAHRAEAELKRREALAAVEKAAQAAAEGQETGAALAAAQGLLRDEEILIIVRRYELRHLEERRARERRHAFEQHERQRTAGLQHATPAAAIPAAAPHHATSPHPAPAHGSGHH